MATHLIPVLNQTHLDQIRAQHANILIYFDNPYDTASQKLKMPLHEFCKKHDLILASVRTPQPLVKNKNGLESRLPILTAVKEAEMVGSFYEYDAEKLCAQLEAMYRY